jgi:hypothetical protein
VAIGAALVLSALSLLYPSTPSYDPWAWIQWGRDILQGELNTDTGPSWKPLPVFFTVLFAPFGDAAPDLWLWIARAGAILALVAVYRLSSRAVGGGKAGIGAGLVAAGGLLLSVYWLRNSMFGYSEGILIACTAYGIERHLDGHRGQAFALLFGASLLRPEAWAFFGLYGLWLFWKHPEHRKLVIGLFALIPVLWFLPEWWGSGDPLRAASRAQEAVGGPSLEDNPIVALLEKANALVQGPIRAGVALGVGFGVWQLYRTRKVPLVLWFAVLCAAWLGVVAVMTRGGFSGNERYLSMPVALAAIVAGAGFAFLVRALGSLGNGARWTTPVAAVAVFAVAFPFMLPRVDRLERDDYVLRFEGQLRDDLQTVVDQAGGRDKILECGPPFAGAYNVAMVSWMLDVSGEEVGYQPGVPSVIFRARARPGVNPTPPVNTAWTPVTSKGEWTVYEACSNVSRSLK